MSKHASLSKARQLRKSLDLVKDIAFSAVAFVLVAGVIASVVGVFIGTWVMGLGYIPISIGVLGAMVVLWSVLNAVANDAMEKERDDE